MTLWVAAINPRPQVSLRFLTFRSPPLPLGVWMAIAAVGGAAVSGTASALALRQGSPQRQRQVRIPIGRPHGADQGQWSDPVPDQPHHESAWAGSTGPARPPGEPAPTLSVPFRVIRPGRAPAQVVDEPAAPEPVVPESAVSATARPAGAAQGMDDWTPVEDEEW